MYPTLSDFIHPTEVGDQIPGIRAEDRNVEAASVMEASLWFLWVPQKRIGFSWGTYPLVICCRAILNIGH